MKKRGKIFVVAGPSGVGKGTVLTEMFKKHPELNLSVSVTTRAPRAGEADGVNYYFKTVDEFKELVENDRMLEWAEFAGNYYGTCFDIVQDAVEQGKDMVLEIEVKGAKQVKEKVKDAVFIFIYPPSFEELKRRLIGRKTETKEDVERRLNIMKEEIEQSKLFDYRIINDDLEKAVGELEKIIVKERENV